jgi:hypothetical protein
MDIDIDHRWRQLQKEYADWMSTHHQQTAISFSEGVLKAPILNPAAIQEEILVLAG